MATAHPSFSSTGFGSGNVMVRLQSALSVPFPSRIFEVESVIKSTSTKELRNVLPALLENIFGFGSEQGWGLDKITKSYNRSEFETGRRFLSPEGPLLKVIYALQSDPYLSYEFPVSCLPSPTRHTLEQGGLPVFFVNKLQPSNMGRPILSLGAFEFYLFHFAYCLVNPQWQRNTGSWNNPQDFLYPSLVQDYLHYYLPLDRNGVGSGAHMPASPVRSAVVSSVSMISGQLPGYGSPQGPSSPRSHHTSLLRPSLNTSLKQHVLPNPPVLDQSEAEVWRCDTLMQVFTEFWLNQNASEGERPGVSQPSLESFLPSTNHVRVVRLLIKYLHYFSNSASPDIITSPYQQPSTSPLDDFKKSVRQQIVQKRLYSFLRHAFDRWPLDSSFRLVLETWLSYIQPWRYSDFSQQNVSRQQESDEKVIDVKWSRFVHENLLFYTVLLEKFFPRAFRMDLTSPFSAYMVFRVVKVLALPNLATLVEQAEGMLYESAPRFTHMSITSDLGGSFLPLDHGNMVTAVHQQLSELERPGFLYQPMFGEDTLRNVDQLLQQILCAKAAVVALQHQTATVSSGWLSWLSLSALFDDGRGKIYGDLTASEVKKLDQHLAHAAKKLCDIFRLTPPGEVKGDNSFDVSSYGAGDGRLKSEASNPDIEETEHGVKLTPLGRFQVVNGIRHFTQLYEGDPDELPIKSFENATLVRVLHGFCHYINQQFGKNIHMWYGREDFIGRMARVYFAPPLKPSQSIQSPLSSRRREKLSSPRLSLRFLASYPNLLTLGITYLLIYIIFGFGPVGFLFVISLFVLMFGLLRALLQPQSAKLKRQ